jgi:NADPH-dependent 2,4-dienoyl-CoA reductase/sulfur reductase-like enzyme/peroxiredoxin family protein/TusA-related sulfurtransferase/rhodanese-related sulfurtransferase
MKILIVGGVAGGASAATRLRRMSEDAEIIMFERGEHISFANCGLPYHIGETIKNRDVLLVQTVEGMKNRFNVDVRIKSEVLSIDRDKKEVEVKNLETMEVYKEKYDKLLLSPGAEPFVPPIKGIESKNIFTLRNLLDMDKIKEKVDSGIQRAVVVGAGFIGVEIAENLVERDIKVTIVEKANQVLAPVDFEIAAQIHSHIKDKEVELYLENSAVEFKDIEGKTKVLLEDGTEIMADIVIMAIGVKPETKLARECGLEIGKTGGIKVDSYLQTSDQNIYAVGDAIEVKGYTAGNESLIPLAWPANRQGRIVADTILGVRKKSYDGSLGTAILKAFDLTVAATGLNEKILKRLGIDYMVATVNRNNHAGYYPGSTPMVLKLIFDKEGNILGAQGIGIDGVDKRIDIIATAIKGKLKVADLQEIEVAYAPPFNSAKDPVNIAGYVAENMLNEEVKTARYFEIPELLSKGNYELLDIRTKDENSLGTIPNSKHISLGELRDNLYSLNKNTTYIVYCQVGLRGYLAYRILTQNGFKALNLDGGYKLWYYTQIEQNNKNIFDEKEFKHHSEMAPEIQKELVDEEREVNTYNTIELDACGLQCPGPILKTREKMEHIKEGDALTIKASDPGFKKDIKVWAEKTGNKLISVQSEKGLVVATVQKQKVEGGMPESLVKDTQTLVVFSGDLDKVLASFIIANGALAMGKKVSMFFTFWGLNALRKENVNNRNKPFLDKMFGMMMPKGTGKLKLSKMNMGGMGTAMMKYVMKEKNVDSLETLLKTYLENGGKITACTMSMDVMGITKEELIDGIEYGGVASYLGDAQDAYSNLFI